MGAMPSRSDSPYLDDLRASLDGIKAAVAEHEAAASKCAAAAEDCMAAANRFVVAANAYAAAFADLEITIIQFKTAIKCVEDAHADPAAPTKALCGIATNFYNATIKAHETIVDASNAAEKAEAAYGAKNKTLCAEAAALESKINAVGDKLVAFDAKLKEASRVLSERDVVAFRAEAVAAVYQGENKAKVAIVEQFVASKAVELVEKKCASMAAMRDTVQDDIMAAIGRMGKAFESVIAGADKPLSATKDSPPVDA